MIVGQKQTEDQDRKRTSDRTGLRNGASHCFLLREIGSCLKEKQHSPVPTHKLGEAPTLASLRQVGKLTYCTTLGREQIMSIFLTQLSQENVLLKHII